jgi:hypothetical protein
MDMGITITTLMVDHLVLKIIMGITLSFHILMPMKTNGSLPPSHKLVKISKNNKSQIKHLLNK